VRTVRRKLIVYEMDDPGSPGRALLRDRQIKRLLRKGARTVTMAGVEARRGPAEPEPLKEDAKLAIFLTEYVAELARLDGYERRAL
jgi:hypothetical protein